jgi:hypothetical protein
LLAPIRVMLSRTSRVVLPLVLLLRLLTTTSVLFLVQAAGNHAKVDEQQGGAGDDLYALLGVSKTAAAKEIKSAYRRKALVSVSFKREPLSLGIVDSWLTRDSRDSVVFSLEYFTIDLI